MSRNGSGVYSVPNTFVAGGTITASGHNQNWSDLATELTNSVAADGQTSMTGALKASLGSLASPSYTFAADLNTGRYRKSADTMADVCGGTEVVEISSTGVSITGDVNATSVKQAGFALLPVGSFFPYAGSTAPSGYLFCRGQAISRTTYAALFAAIGTAYGSGDGSTTFNVPDLTGRVPAGLEASATRLTSTYFSGDSTALGATGGSESHTLTAAQIPQLSGNTNGSSSTARLLVADFTSTNGGGTAFSATNSSNIFANSGAGNAKDMTVTIPSLTVNVNTSGGGNPHNNVQPTIISNYIIFAGV